MPKSHPQRRPARASKFANAAVVQTIEPTPPAEPDDAGKSARTRRTSVTAEDLAKKQREISVSEFFTKNRHLLGFDNPRKALLTTVKEAVDNSLDACEEADILPDIIVEVRRVNGSNGGTEAPPPEATSADGAGTADAPAPVKDEDVEAVEKQPKGATARPERFVVSVTDNGPGILAAQIPKVFGKLLYGSKFHRLRQSRGQQGIGISAAGMYGQLTTGKPVRILSKTGPKKKAKYIEIHLDTRKNAPEVLLEEERDWDVPHGTRVEIELEAKYQKGQKSVDDYLRQTALANPHVSITYRSPEAADVVIERAAKDLPAEPREIKPHPYGVELGFLIQMLKDSESKHLKAFLHSEFSRVSPATAAEICKKAGLSEQAWTSRIAREEADALHTAMSQVDVMNPPTDCVSPIGEESILKSLEREYPGAVTFAITRRPAVYRGNPFQIEVAIAFGGQLPAEEPATLLRFANRVPLLYQQSACAVTKAMISCPWRSYGLEQPKGAPPVGPLVLLVHLASVWVPFTSESKEAIAHYPEILREVRLAAMDCGRRLGLHIRREKRIADAEKKKGYIQKYIPHIAAGLADILSLSDKERGKTIEILTDVLERSRTI
ncbi:MAG: DNA topoisomerase VI subunit B [Planctomycetes bacterium]|nr:DNA topoisomerase VI subunit B [Planctomycetota bacterium]MBI3847572.1 DNA topoisomerase VI subunit B [Planctomycetota bacterium]